MSEYEVKKIDEMEAVYGGAFKRARAELASQITEEGVMELIAYIKSLQAPITSPVP